MGFRMFLCKEDPFFLPGVMWTKERQEERSKGPAEGEAGFGVKGLGFRV